MGFVKFLGVVGGLVGATSTVAGVTYTAQNPELVKDYIKGNETYSSQQMSDVKLSYENLLNKVQAENAEAKLEIEELKVLINSANLQIKDLQDDNLLKSSEISNLNNSIIENNSRIAELEKSNDDKSEEIKNLQADNLAKIEEIESLSSSVEVNNAQISDLQSQISSYEDLLINYVVVTYVIDGISNVVIQRKGSTADYHNFTTISGFAGWSKTEDGLNIVDDSYIVEDGDIFFAVIQVVESTFVVKEGADEYTYTFREGMTFREWVESEYNVDGYYISGNKVCVSVSDFPYEISRFCLENGEENFQQIYKLADHEIVSGYDYRRMPDIPM